MSRIIELRQSDANRYENVHEWLQQTLDLPEWYGSNLDALWDCITGYVARPLTIRWIADSVEETEYAAVVELLQEAADAYEDIDFKYMTLPS